MNAHVQDIISAWMYKQAESWVTKGSMYLTKTFLEICLLTCTSEKRKKKREKLNSIQDCGLFKNFPSFLNLVVIIIAFFFDFRYFCVEIFSLNH